MVNIAAIRGELMKASPPARRALISSKECKFLGQRWLSWEGNA